MSEQQSGELECIGDIGDRHVPVGVEPKKSNGEWHWTCPRCGWLLKEFFGEDVEDHV